MLLAEKNKALQEKQNYEIYAATLRERNRIAREIHDNVGHLLSRTILLTGAAKTLNRDKNMESLLEGLDTSLNSAMNSIRSSVHNLHDESETLREIAEGIIKDFENCTMEYDMSEIIPNKIKYCFAAIIKEALTVPQTSLNRPMPPPKGATKVAPNLSSIPNKSQYAKNTD